ncbi:hypothetical protein ABK040_011383 [Willaertia magna]
MIKKKQTNEKIQDLVHYNPENDPNNTLTPEEIAQDRFKVVELTRLAKIADVLEQRINENTLNDDEKKQSFSNLMREMREDVEFLDTIGSKEENTQRNTLEKNEW